MFHSFGWPEALIILTVILIVFGVGKLPQVGGALGKGMREFRRGRAGLLEAGGINPWIVGGLVVTAVAIPVAIHNADNDSPAS